MTGSSKPRASDRGGRSVGLGLCIVSEIAKAHGAHAPVSSAEGQGPTFRVEWPRARIDRP